MKRPITYSLVVAAIMLAAAAGLRYADSLHLLGSDGRTRGIEIVIGLALALFANFMPKMLSKTEHSPQGARRMQSALRVGGWLFTLAGLGYAALAAFAPPAIAFPASIALVAGALVTTLGYAVACPVRSRRAGSAR